MYFFADCGGVSRPSAIKWMHRRPPESNTCRAIVIISLISECTRPSDIRPAKCTIPPESRTEFIKSRNGALLSQFSNWNRRKNWFTTRPEPIVMCPTSEFPIVFAGNPTDSPLASRRECGYFANNSLKNCIFALATALWLVFSLIPTPSIIHKTIGFFMFFPVLG